MNTPGLIGVLFLAFIAGTIFGSLVMLPQAPEPAEQVEQGFPTGIQASIVIGSDGEPVCRCMGAP